MQVRIGFVAVWIATTAAGMAISWAGVGDALRGTALPIPDLAAQAAVHEGRPPASEPAPAAPTATASSGTAQASSTREPVPPATKPATERPTARPTKPPKTEPDPAPAGGDVRTYVVKSGRVVLALSADSARLVSASPNSGFQAKVWRKEEWLRVDLTDGVNGSAVFATWNGHPPLVEVYEY
ncbi:hypothetical protein [Actinocorallia libanotica]|uniref:Secreted protein n=1 Tax=Actinocorallia libanotica TaxID=46162 RepID=A0ABP4C860_9ACTN